MVVWVIRAVGGRVGDVMAASPSQVYCWWVPTNLQVQVTALCVWEPGGDAVRVKTEIRVAPVKTLDL